MVFTITEDDDDDTYQFQQPIVMELNAFGSHATFTVPEPADDSSSLCWALLLLVLTIFVPCFGLFGCVYCRSDNGWVRIVGIITLLAGLIVFSLWMLSVAMWVNNSL